MTDFSISNARAPAPHAEDAASSMTADAESLITALQEQLTIYEALRDFGRQQAVLIENGELDALMQAITARQRLIDRLMELNQSVADVRAQWETIEPLISSIKRDTVRELDERITSLRREILEQDERDRARMRQSQSTIERELKRVSHGGRAARAYGPVGAGAHTGTTGRPRFTDQRG